MVVEVGGVADEGGHVRGKPAGSASRCATIVTANVGMQILRARAREMDGCAGAADAAAWAPKLVVLQCWQAGGGRLTKARAR